MYAQPPYDDRASGWMPTVVVSSHHKREGVVDIYQQRLMWRFTVSYPEQKGEINTHLYDSDFLSGISDWFKITSKGGLITPGIIAQAKAELESSQSLEQ